MNTQKNSARPKKTRSRTGPATARRTQVVSLGPLRNFIGFQLRRAQDVSFEAFARRVGTADFGPGHFAALSVIRANPDINQVTLSRATGRDKSTLTPVIRHLLKRGFVQRHRSKTDSRAYCLNLTAKGEQHLQKLAVHAEAHDRRLDHIVGDIHKSLLIHLLERIISELGHDLDRK
jgi:DNA-binding MarR family transcriptional regulator